MIWISIGVEVILVGWVFLNLLKRKKGGTENKKENVSLMLMVGSQIANVLPVSVKKRDKTQVYQIMCQIAGEEEGKKIFLNYRQKRWGRIFGIVLLVNTICLLQGLEPSKTDTVLENHQDRPEYGQGTRSQQVTVILEGEEKAEEVNTPNTGKGNITIGS